MGRGGYFSPLSAMGDLRRDALLNLGLPLGKTLESASNVDRQLQFWSGGEEDRGGSAAAIIRLCSSHAAGTE